MSFCLRGALKTNLVRMIQGDLLTISFTLSISAIKGHSNVAETNWPISVNGEFAHI